MRTKFITTSSISRVAVSNAQEAISLAESVNKTLKASKEVKVQHIRQVSTDVARLKEERLSEKLQAAAFQVEFAQTRRQLLDLQR